MQVTFFGSDGFLQPLLDWRLVQFTLTPEDPSTPLQFIREHFKQAVLLENMRGAGQIPNLDYDQTDNSQSMATFESGNGKEGFEISLADKLIPDVDDIGERYHRMGHDFNSVQSWTLLIYRYYRIERFVTFWVYSP